MMKMKWLMFSYLLLCIVLGTRILLYEYRFEKHSLTKEEFLSKLALANDMLEKPHNDSGVDPQEQGKQTKERYSEFQLLNDNLTYVYAGYYDDRDVEVVVKIIAVIPQEIHYNFTCVVYYTHQIWFEVTCYVKFHFARALAYIVNDKLKEIYRKPMVKFPRGSENWKPGKDYHVANCLKELLFRRYRNGFIICPVPEKNGRPTSVSIGKQSAGLPTTRVIVWPPPQQQNMLTRCITPFVKNYGDVSQLVSNIELFRIFGVDKHILYMYNQTQQVVDVVRSYAEDGIIEIRNFSISQPVELLDEFRSLVVYWAQWSAYHDCILSSMYSSKYVIVADTDEIVVPRKHATILELADNLFALSEHDSTPAGALMFRNVYFKTFRYRPRKDFPEKYAALRYRIFPLLYTTRFKTSDPMISPKSLVRPETVDVMFMHYVETFKKGYKNKIVDEDLATLHHYRSSKSEYMYPPETEDNYLLRFSSKLTSAVANRFEKILHLRH